MIRIWILFIAIFVLSCSNNNSEVNNETDEVKGPLIKGLKSFQLADSFFEKTEFLNGDPIKQAQSAGEWKKACVNKEPAWCYVDLDKKTDKLYNYYVLTDKRGIAPKNKFISKKELEDLQKELTSNQNSIQFNWNKESSFERSFIGNNYDLKFVNFWYLEDAAVETSKVQVAVLNQKSNELILEMVSPNNGYHIWLKK